MKLISMTEKVLQLSKDLGIGGDTFHDFYLKTTYYANFLSQPLTLSMFIPCVDNVPLEIPIETICGVEKYTESYNKAKENVLFEGFFTSDGKDTKPTDVKSVTNGIMHVFWYNNIENWYLSRGLKTIEDLIQYNLTLTESAKQQLKQ